jgi:hypothetical protein
MNKFKSGDVEITKSIEISLCDKETDTKVGIGSYCGYSFYNESYGLVSISGDLSIQHYGELVLKDKIYVLEVLELSSEQPTSLALYIDIVLDEMFPSDEICPLEKDGKITRATYSFRDARNTTKEEYTENFKKREEEIKQQEKR